MAYQIDIKERTFHFKQPAGTSRGIYTTRKSWMVEISDGQHTGIGECAPLPKLSCDDIPDYEQVLRRFCDELERTGTLCDEELRHYLAYTAIASYCWYLWAIYQEANAVDTGDFLKLWHDYSYLYYNKAIALYEKRGMNHG